MMTMAKQMLTEPSMKEAMKKIMASPEMKKAVEDIMDGKVPSAAAVASIQQTMSSVDVSKLKKPTL
jgi:hypothetical protein